MKVVFTIIFIMSVFVVTNAQTVFTDISTTAGILSNTRAEGIAVGDFNNDGYDDFYTCSPYIKNQLYRNNGDETFTEVAGDLGMDLLDDTHTQAAVWGDINNDGWLDLYVTNKSVADALFLNKGDGTFDEISFNAGIVHQGNPKSVNMADINNDGFLDIYISNFYSENALYLNNGDLTFTNYIYASGALDQDAAMGTIFFDYDKDGDVDLYLVHDSYDPNFLYQNDGNGVFTEVGVAAGVNTASFGMGVDVADVNHDGWLDIYIANLGPNFLLLNNGDGTFSNMSQYADVEDGGMGWGTVFMDFDNDSWKDIYVGNLYQFNPNKNILYRNNGDSTFTKAEENEVVSNQLGTHGVAYFDFNLDGQLDILAANREPNEQLQVFKNANRQNNWLSLKLIGTIGNYNAIGAKIELIDNLGTLHYQEVVAGHSWSSQSSSLVHVGLGNATEITTGKIIWTTGDSTVFNLSDVNEIYTIYEDGTVVSGLVNTKITAKNTASLVEVAILPNPNQGHFNLQFSLEKTAKTHIEIYTTTGQLIYNEIINTEIGEHRIPINLSTIANQMVLIKIYNNDFHQVKSCFLVNE